MHFVHPQKADERNYFNPVSRNPWEVIISGPVVKLAFLACFKPWKSLPMAKLTPSRQHPCSDASQPHVPSSYTAGIHIRLVLYPLHFYPRHTRLWSEAVRAAPLLAVAVQTALQARARGRGDAVGAAAELEGVAAATGELAGPGGCSALLIDQFTNL